LRPFFLVVSAPRLFSRQLTRQNKGDEKIEVTRRVNTTV